MKRIDHRKYGFLTLLKFIFCVFFLLNRQDAFSQDVTLSLSINDLSGKSVTNPTISINQLPSGRLLYRSADNSLQFKINRNSKISLQVTAISMRTFDTIIQVTVSDIFLKVKMEPVSSTMSGVTVVSVKKPLMKEEDDDDE